MPTVFDARIEDGKLFYDKKWFHRGQNVLIETNELKFNAILVQIGSSEVCLFCEAFFICIKSK
jgi:Sin3 histone deacetylase corepressor complex component SDS3